VTVPANPRRDRNCRCNPIPSSAEEAVLVPRAVYPVSRPSLLARQGFLRACLHFNGQHSPKPYACIANLWLFSGFLFFGRFAALLCGGLPASRSSCSSISNTAVWSSYPHRRTPSEKYSLHLRRYRECLIPFCPYEGWHEVFFPSFFFLFPAIKGFNFE